MSSSLQSFLNTSLKTEIPSIWKVCPPEEQDPSAQSIIFLKLVSPHYLFLKISFQRLERAVQESCTAHLTQKTLPISGADDDLSFRTPAWSIGINPGAVCDQRQESNLLPIKNKPKKNQDVFIMWIIILPILALCSSSAYWASYYYSIFCYQFIVT